MRIRTWTHYEGGGSVHSVRRSLSVTAAALERAYIAGGDRRIIDLGYGIPPVEISRAQAWQDARAWHWVIYRDYHGPGMTTYEIDTEYTDGAGRPLDLAGMLDEADMPSSAPTTRSEAIAAACRMIDMIGAKCRHWEDTQ